MIAALESSPCSVVPLDERAAECFFLLSEVSRLLAEGHAKGYRLKYKIGRSAGYEIHITIVPDEPERKE